MYYLDRMIDKPYLNFSNWKINTMMAEIRSHVSGTNSICCHNMLTQSSQKVFPHYSRNFLLSETS